ncbi:MAG: hypothetical protein JWO19_2486 [Bryobacterales bacterium]|jgi:hypothetical protein|nr:hypothetical protein [Bryobacterales bacterium]
MPDEIYQPKKYFEDPAEKFARKYPHHHQTFFNRPDFTRRRFFQVAGAGLAGSYLMGQSSPAAIVSQNMTTKNTAKNCIFILLTGAISSRDSWNLKVTSDISAAVQSRMNPTMINNVNWPVGIFPKLGQHLGDVALVRSMSAWALVHSLAQTWAQIGRNPAAALGNIAPNIGSVVAIEKDKERRPGQVFPAFVALNSGGGIGPGYLPATYAPFRLNQPNGTNGTVGIPGTTNSNGQGVFNTMFSRLHQIDDPLRSNSPYGSPLQDYDAFYSAAKGMMYNPAVTQAFTFSAADSQRYGVNNNGTSFGNSCLVAKQILAADQGTRFIQISFGSWDMHTDIYGLQNPNGSNMFTMGPQLDAGVAALIDDLKAAGQFDSTLIVMVGEFGRTPGISAAGGRDHFLLLSAMLAGGGISGGKVIGATNTDNSMVTDYGWDPSNGNPLASKTARYVRPEDLESTIYSAMGIDWTTIRYDDPFKRGFEYVPFASQGTYSPLHDLWS